MLGRCLHHLQNQVDAPPFEVIVSIDGDDAYPEYRGLGFPVTVVHSRGHRQAAAVNRALEEAGGEFVLILGDDILAAPDLLRRHQVRLRELNDPRAAVQGKVSWHPELLPDPLL